MHILGCFLNEISTHHNKNNNFVHNKLFHFNFTTPTLSFGTLLRIALYALLNHSSDIEFNCFIRYFIEINCKICCAAPYIELDKDIQYYKFQWRKCQTWTQHGATELCVSVKPKRMHNITSKAVQLDETWKCAIYSKQKSNCFIVTVGFAMVDTGAMLV